MLLYVFITQHVHNIPASNNYGCIVHYLCFMAQNKDQDKSSDVEQQPLYGVANKSLLARDANNCN